MWQKARGRTIAFAIAAWSVSVSGWAAKGPGRQIVVLRRIDGPYVLAGTPLDVTLEQPLDAGVNREGDVFIARVTAPVLGPRGETVILPGARLTGRVIEAIDAGGLSLALKFDSIDTVRGPAAVHATVESAGRHATIALFPPRPGFESVPREYDALLRPVHPSAIGGGPPESGAPRVTPPVRIPASSVMRVSLLEALIPPSVRVEIPPVEYLERQFRTAYPLVQTLP